jgi:O-antigen/teichoic acid export membrane protein
MQSAPLTPDTIARRTLRGAFYAGVAQYAALAIGIVKGAILARLVIPEIFGIVAYATTWVSFLTLFRMELSPVVVSDPSGNRARLVTQFILEIVTTASGFVLAGLLYLVAPSVCSPRCWHAIAAILAIRMVAAFTSTPLYILSRDIRQKTLTRLTLLGALGSLAVAPLAAYLGFPLLALLLDVAIPVVVSGVGAWLATGWRVTRDWDAGVARDTISFGFTLWTNGLLGKIIYEFDDWLVGRVKGNAALGFYSKAYALAKMPMDVFAGVVGQLAPALYAQSLNADPGLLAHAYTRTTWLLTRLVALSSIVMLAAAEEIIRILLGPTWLPIAPLLRLMFLFALGRPLMQNNAQLMVVMRREKLLRRFYLLEALILLLLGPPAVLRWGGAGASIVVSVMMAAGLLVSQWHVSRRLSVSVIPLYLLPTVLTVLLTPFLYGVGQAVGAGVIVSLLLKGLIGVTLFGGVVYLLEREAVGEVLARVRDLWRVGLAGDEESHEVHDETFS